MSGLRVLDRERNDIKNILNKACGLLRNADTGTPALDAELILCHILGKDREFLYANGDFEVDEKRSAEFFEAVRKRQKGMPVQYITGRQEFMSLEFSVNPSVLIPRPDTEILVEHVVEAFEAGMPEDITVLDIGTGSGCIAVSLAYYIKNCRVYAMDVSSDALQVAEENARHNGVRDRIRFIEWDIFNGLRDCPECRGLLFDAVVSNPPYIPSGDIPRLNPGVRDYEPCRALDGGCDGLMFFRRIIESAPGVLKEGGLLALEVGCGQSSDVTEICRAYRCYRDIGIRKDLNGIDRVVSAVINCSRD